MRDTGSCLYVRIRGVTDSCMLTFCATGPHPRCFFHRGGVRALSSDKFQEILRPCFTYGSAKTGGLHSVAFGCLKMWGSQLISFTHV
jgi:hypothetical protein